MSYDTLCKHVDELKATMRKMVDFKEKLVKVDYKDDDLMEKLLELKKKSVFLFSRINSASRDLHWDVHVHEKALKPPQAKLLELVDKMENVAYEKAQLLRKIRACQSHHVDLDNLENVVSKDEFKSKGGKLLQDKNGETLDEKKNCHQFQLSRLQFELEQRQELLEDEKKIKQEVGTTQQVNTTRKNLIDGTLGSKLENLFTAAAPLREVFNLPRPTLAQPRNSMYLPTELYAIFYSCWCQKHIYNDVDTTVSLDVMNIPQAPANKRRKLSDGRSVANTSNAELHPVKLCIQFDTLGVQLILQLFQPLRLIVSKIALKNGKKWTMEDPRIFSCLFPSERHYEFPLPPQLGKNSGRDSFLAFSWLQALSCEFVPGKGDSVKAAPVSLRDLIKKLGERLDVQKSFIHQIKFLQQKKFVPEVERMFKMKSVSQFTVFEHSSDLQEKYYNLSNETPGPDDTNCRFFGATFQSGAVYIQGVVKQPPGYPENKPVVVVHYLSGKYKKPEVNQIFKDSASADMVLKASSTKTQRFDNSAKDIQIAANDLDDLITESNRMNILSIMLKKLQLCFDIHTNALVRKSRTGHGVPVRKFFGKDRSQDYSSV